MPNTSTYRAGSRNPWLLLSLTQEKNKSSGKRSMDTENRICRQIQDLHASFAKKERRKHRGCSQSCTYTLFLPKGAKMTLSYSMGSGFRDMSKLTYLDMKHDHWQRFHNLRIWSLSTPEGWRPGWSWTYFHSTGISFEILADIQNGHIWAWNLVIGKVPEVEYILSRYWLIFKIDTFGHETWPLALGGDSVRVKRNAVGLVRGDLPRIVKRTDVPVFSLTVLHVTTVVRSWQ